MVFDGENLPSKKLTEDERKNNREINKKKGDEYLK